MKALILLTLLALPCVATAQDSKPDAPPRGADKPAAQADPNAALIEFQKPCYPLKTCAVCGHDMEKKGVDAVVDRHLVVVCSDACKGGIEAKKAEVFKKIDDAVIAAQKPGYPLEKCPISGEKLGGMGEPVDLVVGMRLVRLCCGGCSSKLTGNPEPTLGRLEKAYVASQKAAYTVAVCPVSGDKLEEGKAVDKLYGTTLVRLCCNDCEKALKRSPNRVMNKLASLKEGKPFEAEEPKEKDKEGRAHKEGGEKRGGGGEKKNG